MINKEEFQNFNNGTLTITFVTQLFNVEFFKFLF